jgi:hypothetical protein
LAGDAEESLGGDGAVVVHDDTLPTARP